MAFSGSRDAETAFYRAFVDRDFTAMRSVWSEAGDVQCIHPRGPVITGKDAVMASWRAVLGSLPAVDMKIRLLQQWDDQSSAVHLVEERFQVNGKPLSRPVIATNVYRSESGGWKLVMHFAATEGGSMTPRDVKLH